MSTKYAKVKTYYDRGLWNIDKVRNAVVKGWITAEECEEITGEPYIPPEEQAMTADFINALTQLGVNV